MGHKYPEPFTLKTLVTGIYLPDIQSVTIAMDADQRLESLNCGGTGKCPEVPRVPDLVHRLKEGFDVGSENPVGV